MRTRRSISSGSLVAPPHVGHQSVLLYEVLNSLALKHDDVVVDATLGGAGHALAMAKELDAGGALIGFDLDDAALTRARNKLSDTKPRVHLVRANFRDLPRELDALGVTSITKALFDLGWSSYQLDSGRGFSFLADEPLVMTYGEGGITAAAIVNTWSEKTLSDIIFGWGEERYSRRIAKAIVERRTRKPFTTSRELADVIAEATPIGYRRGRIHPATRTFQALRIAANDELGALEGGLHGAWYRLAEGGRIAVISFHSLEDRIVKRQFAEWEKLGQGRRLTKKPIVPTAEEIARNPRARSAKLRVIEKTFQHENSNTKDQQIRPLHFSGET